MSEAELTEDEWREQKFSEEALMSARRVGKVAYQDLLKHLERFGPDGILESAVLLPRTQYEALEKKVKATATPRTIRRRRR